MSQKELIFDYVQWQGRVSKYGIYRYFRFVSGDIISLETIEIWLKELKEEGRIVDTITSKIQFYMTKGYYDKLGEREGQGTFL